MAHIRIGIVGCGEVTQIMHLPSLRQLSDLFTVTAVCDVSRTVMDGVGNLWGIPHRVTDFRALADRPDVDAVLIANPNAYHAETALAAIAAGKHVLVEKPMCMNLRETDAIAEAAAKKGVVVQVGYMRRYAPAFIEACRLIGSLGPIKLARAHDILGSNSLIVRNSSNVIRGNDVPASVIEEGRRLGAELIREAIGACTPDLETAYGILLGLCSHDFSAMRELLGKPRRVLYAGQRQNGLYIWTALDYGVYICNYEAVIDGIPRFDAGIEVYGEKQGLKVVYDTPYIRNLPVRLHILQANQTGGVDEKIVHPSWGDCFVEEWKAFHAHVTEHTAPKTSPADFREDLLLFIDMMKMMRT